MGKASGREVTHTELGLRGRRRVAYPQSAFRAGQRHRPNNANREGYCHRGEIEKAGLRFRRESDYSK